MNYSAFSLVLFPYWMAAIHLPDTASCTRLHVETLAAKDSVEKNLQYKSS